MQPNLDLFELVLRLATAAGAGIAIGFEREVGDHVAGIRTHTLVAVGAAVFAIGGAYGFTDIPRAPVADPARVAAQIASGIGFIGAGAIVKDGVVVRGLTTAATLWLSAALGMAGGTGAYAALAAGLVIVMLVLIALRMVKPAARRVASRSPSLRVTHLPIEGTLDAIARTVEASGAKVERMSIREDGKSKPTPTRIVVLELRNARNGRLVPVIEELTLRDDVLQVGYRPGNDALTVRLGARLRRLIDQGNRLVRPS
ncbi:MgtC/SapB family protein [Rhizohabitans arisaemae]|uniref:MgtC/SapB family protein n=1 Tax=Rhizohabitans arisaemae TaxID=2720610 RepID=UPI0024B20384|nr:MgtC/SapB family protein [Rhizohabitans arisaemae]